MIKNIRIRNFKSLRDVAVPLGPITVLIGRGGTGKSNFVKAFAFLRDVLLVHGSVFSRSPPTESVFCKTAGNDETVDFTLIFDAPNYEADLTYKCKLQVEESHGLVFVGERLLHGKDMIFAKEGGVWKSPPPLHPIPDPQPIALQNANGLPVAGMAYLLLTAGIGCYNFPSDVLQGEQSSRSKYQSDAIGFADDGSNYLDCFDAINRNVRDVAARAEIIGSLRLLKPALSDIRLALPGKDSISVSLQYDARTLVLDLVDESEGFRRLLAHLIALFQVPPKPLLIMEEPEKGLYPAALNALAEQLRAYADDGRGQVILTTHNPLLLEHFSPKEIRVVEMENLETRIGTVSKEQRDAIHDELQTTDELLTVDPARTSGNQDVGQ